MKQLVRAVVALAVLVSAAHPQDVERIRRKHTRKADQEFLYLQERRESGTEWGRRTIRASRAEEDLDQLEWELVQRFAYLTLRDVDYEAAFDAVRLGLGEEISCSAFAVQVMKLLALFGDGHSVVIESSSDALPRRCADYLLADAERGVVAFRGDRSGFLDEQRPYLASLDGVPLEHWIAAAGRIVSRGSPQLVRERSIRNLRYVGHVRQELGLEDRDVLALELVDADGLNPKILTSRVTERRALYGSWPRSKTRRLEDDVGYLRVEQMSRDADFLAALTAAMEGFADTSGLIIDVRGNGGGSRDALRLLAPWFLPAEPPHHVGNVAAYRLPDGEKEDREGHLANRTLYPAGASVWSKEQRAALRAFEQRFEPGWRLPQKGFSDWHYLVLEPAADHPRYERPVVVLLDSVCFSATDIFLGALQGLPGVTLMGTPSAGGSGRSRELKLAHSRVDLKLSSMASFRADGSPYDGRGVEPDVILRPVGTDHIGRTDTVLERALERLRQEPR